MTIHLSALPCLAQMTNFEIGRARRATPITSAQKRAAFGMTTMRQADVALESKFARSAERAVWCHGWVDDGLSKALISCTVMKLPSVAVL
jgi:hypothetical protein